MAAWRGDEEGAIQAFEAVLAAVIILTALILFAVTQRAALPEGGSGQDLRRVAADALDLLQVPDAGQATIPLWVYLKDALSDGSAPHLDSLRSAVNGVLPADARWALSIDNGFATLPVVARDLGPFAVPVAGDGAAAYVSISPTVSGAAEVEPGDPYPFGFTLGDCVQGPLSSAAPHLGPGGAWVADWQATPGRVPPSALFGTWTSRSNADCTGASSTVSVGLAGTVAAAPLYAANLVVWTLG